MLHSPLLSLHGMQDEMKEEHERKLVTLKVNKLLFSIFMFSVRGLSHEIAVI